MGDNCHGQLGLGSTVAGENSLDEFTMGEESIFYHGRIHGNVMGLNIFHRFFHGENSWDFTGGIGRLLVGINGINGVDITNAKIMG